MAAPRRYPEEFKDSAVREVVENSRPIAQVAGQRGVDASTLSKWVHIYKDRQSDVLHAQRATAVDDEVLARLEQLEEENRHLRDREVILKKAAAVFAQDML